MKFEYELPVNVVFGRGTSDSIGAKINGLGKRALIVTGGSSTKRSGLLDKAEALLHEQGISSVLFDKIMPNPLTTTVYEGAALANAEGCDVVLALGGGSSIDAAKGIAFQAVNGGDINDYIFGRAFSDQALPLVAVPTTCGTGSEGNGFAVMTNPETLDKKSLRCKAIIPACSIIDPLLMTSMPKSTLASVGFDALCHNIEAYLSSLSQPITDRMALDGVRLAAQSLRRVYADTDDLDSWDNLCLASLFGGMTIGLCGVTAPHGMEHPVSGLSNITHGQGLAALVSTVTRHTLPAGRDKYDLLAKEIGGAGATDFVEEIEKLLTEVGLRFRLKDFGITQDDVPWLAENCLKISLNGLKAHPKFFDRNELEAIYYEAL